MRNQAEAFTPNCKCKLFSQGRCHDETYNDGCASPTKIESDVIFIKAIISRQVAGFPSSNAMGFSVKLIKSPLDFLATTSHFLDNIWDLK